MDVGTFAVDEFAEHAFLGHVKGGQLEEVVAAVLEHHAVALGLFSHIDELPAFFDGGGSRHFNGHMLSLSHGFHGHGDMCLPVGADVDEVNVVAGDKFLPSLATRVGSGAGQPSAFKDVGLYALDAVGLNVAQSDDGHAVDVGDTIHGIIAAHTEADETDADILDGVDGKLQDTLLPFDTLRLIENDGVVDDAVVALADFSFGGFLFATGGGHGQQDQTQDEV